MINLDPIHWACVGLGVVCVGLVIHTQIQSAELDAARVTNQVVEVVGNVQNAHAKEEDKESKENKVEVEEQYAKIITDMHITTERLRNRIARRSKLPRAPQVCASATERTEVNWPDIDRAIRAYREGARRIVTKGSEEQAALNAAKLWIEKEVE